MQIFNERDSERSTSLKENKEVYFVCKYKDKIENKILLDSKAEYVQSKTDSNLVDFYFEGNVGILQNLNYVYLFPSGLTYIPDFNYLPNLKRLYIEGSKIEKFNDCEINLKGLLIRDSLIGNFVEGCKECDEYGNKNKDKQNAEKIIIKSIKLKQLNLEFNNIHEIPFFDIPNLEFLFLSGNHIPNVGKEFKNLKKLKLLDLRDNPIEILDCIDLPDSLEEICIGGIHIFKYFKNIDHLKNLKHVLIGQGLNQNREDYNIPKHVSFYDDFEMNEIFDCYSGYYMKPRCV